MASDSDEESRQKWPWPTFRLTRKSLNGDVNSSDDESKKPPPKKKLSIKHFFKPPRKEKSNAADVTGTTLKKRSSKEISSDLPPPRRVLSDFSNSVTNSFRSGDRTVKQRVSKVRVSSTD